MATKASADDHPTAAAEDHGHGAHTPAHGHAPNRREYIVMFFVLAALTALEVALGIILSKQAPDAPKLALRAGLVGLALTKAACVGLYFMHLKHETKILRLTVMLPFCAPALYAFVLISEAVWRLTRW